MRVITQIFATEDMSTGGCSRWTHRLPSRSFSARSPRLARNKTRLTRKLETLYSTICRCCQVYSIRLLNNLSRRFVIESMKDLILSKSRRLTLLAVSRLINKSTSIQLVLNVRSTFKRQRVKLKITRRMWAASKAIYSIWMMALHRLHKEMV